MRPSDGLKVPILQVVQAPSALERKKPALQTQAASVMLADGADEPTGHAVQESSPVDDAGIDGVGIEEEPVLILYVFTGQSSQVLPSGP